MTLENVIAGILDEAKMQADATRKQAKREADAIRKQAEKTAEAEIRAIDNETMELIAELERVEQSGQRLLIHKKNMETKKAMLDEVREGLVEAVSKMDKKKRAALVVQLAERAKKELPDAKFVLAPEADQKAASGIKSLEWGGTIKASGGVILENAERSIRVNATFETLTADLWEETLHETGKRIFQP